MFHGLIYKAVAEAFGTFSIVFAGCGSVIVSQIYGQALPTFLIPIIFGLIVFVMVHALGHLSGAHMNPAVTIALALTNKFPRQFVVPYCFAQVLGALVAVGLLYYLFPNSPTYGMTLPNVPVFKALIWEIIITFILMFVVMSVGTDSRAVGVMGGASVGVTVAINALVAGPLTGASMNPARSLAPAFAEGRLDVMWIYVLGPILGAIAAAKTYEFIRNDGTRLSEKTKVSNSAKAVRAARLESTH